MKKIQSNSVVLSLIAFELKLVLILHEMNFKIIIRKQGQASCFILLEQNETTQNIDHIIVRSLARCASISRDSFNGR